MIPTRNTAIARLRFFRGLFYERLDEFGIDFTVLYPSCGLIMVPMEDEEMRARPAAPSTCIWPTASASSAIASRPPR